jgi:transposase-like protein
MPKGYPSLSPDQKQEILNRIKDKGERVVDLAKEYGINPKSIYNLLSRSTGGDTGALLELAKLKREHAALLKIVGELIVDQRLGKKIQHRYGR